MIETSTPATWPKEPVRIRIPGDPRYLALVRLVVTTLARSAGFAEEDIDKIEISVDEACTNVLDHAYRDAEPKPPIDVEIRSSAGDFIVDVIDCGRPFDFSSYVPPKLPDHWLSGQARGVGLYLIKKCMDDAQYESLPEQRNRLRLVKKLQPVLS